MRGDDDDDDGGKKVDQSLAVHCDDAEYDVDVDDDCTRMKLDGFVDVDDDDGDGESLLETMLTVFYCLDYYYYFYCYQYYYCYYYNFLDWGQSLRRKTSAVCHGSNMTPCRCCHILLLFSLSLPFSPPSK